MKRLLGLMALLMLVWILPGSARAMYARPEGTYYFSAGGINQETHFFYDEYTGVTHINATAYDIFTNPGAQPILNLGFSFFIKWDPNIQYTDFTIKNLTEQNQDFSFYMAGPIQTVSGANEIFTNTNASITNSGSFSASQRTFLAATPYSYTPGDITGLTPLPYYFDIDLSSSTYQYQGIRTVGPDGDWSFMLVKLSGTVSAGETLTLTGQSEITPTVPVPSTFWLLGSGLIGLVGMSRKKLR